MINKFFIFSLIIFVFFQACSDERKPRVSTSLPEFFDLIGGSSNLIKSVAFESVKVSGSKDTYQVWAKIPMSLRDAKTISEKLKLNRVSNSKMKIYEVPNPSSKFWDLDLQEGVESVGYAANGNMRPNIMLTFWSSGNLYIYKNGLRGGNDAGAPAPES